MIIHLSGQREQDILAMLRGGKFASADEVIDEGLRLVRQHLDESDTKEPADERARRQRGNLRRLSHKLEAMPTIAIDDELSNRAHDRILSEH